MDIRYILDQLYAERQRITEVIETLEKLAQRLGRRRRTSLRPDLPAAQPPAPPGRRRRKKSVQEE
jgi:hypothetical protein